MKPENWISISAAVWTAIALYLDPRIAVSLSLKQTRSQKLWERKENTYISALDSLATLEHFTRSTLVSAQLEFERGQQIFHPSEDLLKKVEEAELNLERLAVSGSYVISKESANAISELLKIYHNPGFCQTLPSFQLKQKALLKSIETVKREGEDDIRKSIGRRSA